MEWEINDMNTEKFYNFYNNKYISSFGERKDQLIKVSELVNEKMYKSDNDKAYNFWITFSNLQPNLNTRHGSMPIFTSHYKYGCFAFNQVLKSNYKLVDLYVIFIVSTKKDIYNIHEISPYDIEMCVTLSVSKYDTTRVSGHMGIFRSLFYYKPFNKLNKEQQKLRTYKRYGEEIYESFFVDEKYLPQYFKDKEGIIIHENISVNFHTFGFFITKLLYPDIEFMRFNPVTVPHEIIKKSALEKTIINKENHMLTKISGESPYTHKTKDDKKYDLKWIHFEEGNPVEIDISVNMNSILLPLFNEFIMDTSNGQILHKINEKNIKDIIIPIKIKFISDACFKDCKSLESVTFLGAENTDEFLYLGLGAFDGCKLLKKINLPKTIKDINSATFRNCESLETITLPENNEVIGNETFNNCKSLKEIIFSKKISIIGDNSFKNCESIIDIVFKSNIIIGSDAFIGCKQLKSITMKNNSIYNETSFPDVNSLTLIYDVSDPKKLTREETFLRQKNKYKNIKIEISKVIDGLTKKRKKSQRKKSQRKKSQRKKSQRKKSQRKKSQRKKSHLAVKCVYK